MPREDLQSDAARSEVMDRVDEVTQVAAEPVELPDIWHADGLGLYSGYARRPLPNRDDFIFARQGGATTLPYRERKGGSVMGSN